MHGENMHTDQLFVENLKNLILSDEILCFEGVYKTTFVNLSDF